jgi:sec-independent protein translocase protein TatC
MAEEAMTLRDHLDELRRRLMFTVIWLVLAVIVAFMFRDQLMDFVLQPGYGGTDDKPIATEVLETVGVIFKVTLMAGFVAALPVILYQVIMFISPGLTGRERAYLFVLLPSVLIAFAGGAAFAYFVLFPPAFQFLSEFGIEHVNPEIRISSYVGVIVSLMFWMGVVFQIPLVLFALARFGIVSPRMLSRFRRFAIVLAFVAAAIITPTFDPVNQVLVAVPIIILYEMGIILARLGQRLRRGAAESDARTGRQSRIGRLFKPFGILKFWRWDWRFWKRGG